MGTNARWCWHPSHSLTSQAKGPCFSIFQFLVTSFTSHCYFPPRHCLMSCQFCVVAVFLCQLNLVIRLQLRCPPLYTHRVSYRQHQDATLCSSFFIYSEEGGFQSREERRTGAWRDQRAISPMAPLDTDFRLNASPGLLRLSEHLSSSITEGLGFIRIHHYGVFDFPLYQIRLTESRLVSSWLRKKRRWRGAKLFWLLTRCVLLVVAKFRKRLVKW